MLTSFTPKKSLDILTGCLWVCISQVVELQTFLSQQRQVPTDGLMDSII